ncbi:MAG: nicotinate-nucleotide diphosphorylase (carboxylating) [Candidatus Riflebacteria bacterium HGW-Riflebacteria-1]|jgi:nicotinate-nucleotide pyrophosphorylase (carboxylating)|nr:MAG: nicotinate-nucleotide diphosphorylase (carboxylating) [Candidatus Riflebacteria bacterium HGW-Riflebacteria-1]
MELSKVIKESVNKALYEDLQGQPDITAMLIPEGRTASARVFTRESMILCGQQWVNEVFHQIDPDVKVDWNYKDGDQIAPDCVIYTLAGKARSLLTGERTALNFLQTLSGVATVTHAYTSKMGNSKTRLLDTRKTIPGLRIAQKYAVKCGGGKNHRMGLFDAFLIKENHISACGSISEAIRAARAIAPVKQVEIEVESIEGLKEAIDAGADIVMLDNFNLERIKEAVALNAGRVKLEVSGDVTLDNIGEFAATNVDFISSGSLTKHIRAINLSMRFDMKIS